MVLYGGYRFPLGDSPSPGGGGESGSGSGVGEREGERQLLRYHFASEQWEVVTETSNQLQPEPRYGHTAVVYDVSIPYSVCYGMLVAIPGSSSLGPCIDSIQHQVCVMYCVISLCVPTSCTQTLAGHHVCVWRGKDADRGDYQ